MNLTNNAVKVYIRKNLNAAPFFGTIQINNVIYLKALQSVQKLRLVSFTFKCSK